MNEKNGIGAVRLTMMALGAVIGGSFFLGSAVAIRAAGPSVLLAFALCGLLTYVILFALSELTVASPDSGSFRVFAARAFGEGAGFVVGWVYWTGMTISLSGEAVAIGLLLRGFAPGLSVPAAGGLVLAAVTAVNLTGASALTKLEGGLTFVKLAAVVFFLALAATLIFGRLSGRDAVGFGALANERFAPGGVKGLLGSLLIVMFSYCGFEVIGFAAPEARDPKKSVPRAIRYTVFALTGLFLLYILLLLPLIPTGALREDTSPIAAALARHGVKNVGAVMNAVLISAIVSSMLATLFGLGRTLRSLAEDRLAPGFLRGGGEMPRRGILASGVCALAALAFSMLFQRAYVFLLGAGGFAAIFTYGAIMASHLRHRGACGCPPDGKCQLPGYPYTSVGALVFLAAIAAGMPFVEGQGASLFAGLSLVAFFTVCYRLMKRRGVRRFG